MVSGVTNGFYLNVENGDLLYKCKEAKIINYDEINDLIEEDIFKVINEEYRENNSEDVLIELDVEAPYGYEQIYGYNCVFDLAHSNKIINYGARSSLTRAVTPPKTRRYTVNGLYYNVIKSNYNECNIFVEEESEGGVLSGGTSKVFSDYIWVTKIDNGKMVEESVLVEISAASLDILDWEVLYELIGCGSVNLWDVRDIVIEDDGLVLSTKYGCLVNKCTKKLERSDVDKLTDILEVVQSYGRGCTITGDTLIIKGVSEGIDKYIQLYKDPNDGRLIYKNVTTESKGETSDTIKYISQLVECDIESRLISHLGKKLMLKFDETIDKYRNSELVFYTDRRTDDDLSMMYYRKHNEFGTFGEMLDYSLKTLGILKDEYKIVKLFEALAETILITEGKLSMVEGQEYTLADGSLLNDKKKSISVTSVTSKSSIDSIISGINKYNESM